ncbi:MAG: spore coat protein [Syntrophomonadaceae bacterium]|nr:spore coat protein [Syntrophomonadaceae bacterium]
MPQHMNPNYSAMATTGAVGTTGTTIGNAGGIGLTDRDLFQIMLNEHKLMTMSMTTLILEAVNPQLRQDCIKILNKNFDHQRMIWEAMHQRGWYQVQMATPQEMQRMQQQLSHQPYSQQQPYTQQPYTQQPTHTQQTFHQQPYMQQSYTQQPYSQSFTQRS